jgi:inosine-uridine nucleoside N-ribohydrolase
VPKVILDCDPGHDDAVAMLYAAAHLDVLAVTTVFGNQSLDRVTGNALRFLRLAGLDWPVAAGAAGPLCGAAIDGGIVHGASGLDGADLPEADRAPLDRHAVDVILEAARAHRGDLVIAATGPLTNLALALSLEPALASWLAGITVMGGGTGVGNITEVAEFNIFCDPEAADIVLRSGVPLWLVGLDVTRRVGVGEADIAMLRQGGRVSRTVADLLDFYLGSLRRVHGLATASLHDPCALVPLIAPELMLYRDTAVKIELAATLTRGMTVCDLRNLGRTTGHLRPAAPPNVRLAREPGSALVPHILASVRAADRRVA